MKNINLSLNQDFIQKLANLRKSDMSIQNSQNNNITTNFSDLLSNADNTQLDVKSTNIIRNLTQKYNICISVTPDPNDKNSVQKESFGNMNISGDNNLVIIPRNLLNKMVNDPNQLKSVENVIKSDISAFKQTECIRRLTGEKTTSTPLTFDEDGNWIKCGWSISNSTSKESKTTKSKQEELNLLQPKLSNTNFNKTAHKIGKVYEQPILNSSLNNMVNPYLNVINNYYSFVGIDKNKYLKTYK